MKVSVVVVALLTLSVALAADPHAPIQLPDADWRLLLNLEGFQLKDDETRSDRQARKMYFRHDSPRIQLTVVMKRAQPNVPATAYRDRRWEQLQSIPPTEEAGRLWTDESRAFFEYFTEIPVQGGPLHQKHIHSFLIHEDSRIEVHVSVTRYREEDQVWLDEFQHSIRVVAHGAPK
jgi:hypothetical protein